MPYQYFALYKPYGVLSQFTAEEVGQITLKDISNFSKDIYPIGRLDRKSEGLLLLTNDRSLNQQVLAPENKQYKTYLVQVEGPVDTTKISVLNRPLTLRIKKNEVSLLAGKARHVAVPEIPERDPPVRFRKTVIDHWLEISILEGKFHQVRKMCAHVDLPVLRLVRTHVAHYQLPSFKVGQIWRIPDKTAILGRYSF